MPVDVPPCISNLLQNVSRKANFTVKMLQLGIFLRRLPRPYIMAEIPGSCHLAGTVSRCQKTILKVLSKNLNFINNSPAAKKAKNRNKLVVNSEL